MRYVFIKNTHYLRLLALEVALDESLLFGLLSTCGLANLFFSTALLRSNLGGGPVTK